MPEEQAFCVLVKIMYEYGLRALYKNNFEDLHCKFYQLERLVQVCFLMFDRQQNILRLGRQVGKMVVWFLSVRHP